MPFSAPRNTRSVRISRPVLEALEDRLVPAPTTLQLVTPANAPLPTASAAAGASGDASVSADGLAVAYASTATNLVAGQAPGPITSNVFLFDRVTGATTLVSHRAGQSAAGGDGDSFAAVVSAGGRYVYYLSAADDLVAGLSGPDTTGLFVYDRVSGQNRLVSAAVSSPTRRADGDAGAAPGVPFSVSADGTRVAYVSAADDVVAGLTGRVGGGTSNVFLADLAAGTTRLVSRQAGSATAGAGGASPALSADGSAVAFVSAAPDVVPGQVGAGPAVYLFRADTGTSVLVSRKAGTTATVAGGPSDSPAVSADGGVVVFRGEAPDLVAQQSSAGPGGNVFVYARSFDTVGLVSHTTQGVTVAAGGVEGAPGGPAPLAVSGDGRLVAYRSTGSGLAGAAPAPGTGSIFLWRLDSVAPGLFVSGSNFLVSGAGGSPVSPAVGDSFGPALSADGSVVAFSSQATNLVPAQASTGGSVNVFTARTAFLLAGQTAAPVLLSGATGSLRVTANGDSSGGSLTPQAGPGRVGVSVGLSAGGTVATFQSRATNLSSSILKANSNSDVFAFDQGGVSPGLSIVSRGAAGVVTAGGNSYETSVSIDNRYSVFVSDALNLIAGQQNNHFALNVFLRDNVTKAVTLVNHVPAPGSPLSTGDSGIPQPPFTPDPENGRPAPPPPDVTLLPAISGDGNWVVFVSNDHNLVPGQRSPGSFANVFRFSRATGAVTLVSHLPGQPAATAAQDSTSPAVSVDGRFIAYVGGGSLFLYDSLSDRATLISPDASSPSMSDDGARVAYVSRGDVYLYDRGTGRSALVSHAADSARGRLLALAAPAGGVTAGAAFSVTVRVQDAFGNTDTGYAGSVTLALGPGSPGAALGGVLTRTAVNGVVTFSGLSLTRAGAGYSLAASAAGVTAARTAGFTVVPGAASRLAFVTTPALSLLNQPLSPAVTVALRDAFGNEANSSAGVTVSLGGPGGATLGGTTTRAASGGMVTFANLTVDRVGRYTLTASAAGLPAVTSSAFDVTAAAAGVTITTVAGNGTSGVGGDGSPATSAQLTFPTDLAVDAAGNLYINDPRNHLVRKVTPDGVITTVAGNGTQGFSGDNGPATAAAFFVPTGLAVDGAGNLYIADQFNHRIRRVTPAGVVTTIAGFGGSLGDFAGDGGPATAARLARPMGLALDGAGNLYIADFDNHRVRKITPGGIITTVAGNGTQGFSGDGGAATAAALLFPTAVAVDGAGNLYIADSGNARVRKVTPGGVITTVAGTGSVGYSGDGGPATAAGLNPQRVAVDGAGNLYISDFDAARVRKVTAAGVITTVAGGGVVLGDGGPAAAAQLAGPLGLVADAAGNLLVADYFHHRVRRVAPTATRVSVENLPDSVPAGTPFSVTAAIRDAGGAVVSGFTGAVTLVFADGPSSAGLPGPFVVQAVAGQATFPLTLTRAGFFQLTFTASGVTGTTSAVFAVTPLGLNGLAFSQQPVNTLAGRALTPAPVVQYVDQFGNLVNFGSDPVTVSVRDAVTDEVILADVTVTPAGGVATFDALTIDRPGTFVLVASAPGFPAVRSQPFTVTATAAAVTISTVVGDGNPGAGGDGGPATAAQLNFPANVTLDAAGNLYLSDDNNVVRKVTPGGVITTVAGNGTQGFSGDGGLATAAAFFVPTGLAVDGAGNLYIADQFNHRIRRVAADGVVTTIAGFGGSLGGFAGDGGPATAGRLSRPMGLALDGAGNLYIADFDNHRVRRITPGGIITTVAGNGTQGFSGDGGPATAAALLFPTAVTVDGAGNLYIADSGNGRVRKVTPGGVITTVAGVGSLIFSGDGGPATAAGLNPQRVAVDGAGNLYISDFDAARVRKVTAAGVITTVAAGGVVLGDGGPAAAAELAGPLGLAADAAGNLFVADSFHHRVRKVSIPATQLAVTGMPPTTLRAGTAFGVAVTVQDAAGNAVSGYTGSVVLTLGPGSPAGARLLGETTVSVNADNGVATFSNLSITQPGAGYTLVASVAGLTPATSAAFTVGSVTATTLTFVTRPVTLTAGAPFTLAVAARDAFGQTDTTFTGAVTVSLGGPGALGGLRTVNAVAGVATFAGLTVSAPGQGFTLSAASAGLATTTAPFNVGTAVPTRLLAVAPPAATAGSPFVFTVSALDSAGNLGTGFSGPVTVTLGPGAPAGAALTGTTTVSAVNGVATFALAVNRAGAGVTLTASAAGLGSATSAGFAVASAPNVLSITPVGAVTAGSGFGVTVTARTADNALDTTFNGPVTLDLGPGSPGEAFLGGPTTVRAVNGVASFSGLVLTRAAAGYTLTATTAGLVGGFSSAFSVVPGAAARLAVATPGRAVAGAAFPLAVVVQDALGNAVTGFGGAVTLGVGANPGGAVLTGALTVTAVAGVATFAPTLSKSGVGFTLTASAAGLPVAASQPFTVGGVTATQVDLVQPAFAVTGVPFVVRVVVRDAAGVVVPSFSGPVTLSLGAGSPAGAVLGGTVTALAVDGVATFPAVTLAEAGTGFVLAASAGGLTGSAPALAVLTGGDGPSWRPVVSANGARVAYVSQADNLVAGRPASLFSRVFLYDAATGVNVLASGTGNGHADSAVVNEDGTLVAFRSDASDLLPGQGAAVGNIFLYRAAADALTLVSKVSGSAALAAGGSTTPGANVVNIDGTGDKIVYLSRAGQLAAGQAGGGTLNAFLYERTTGASYLVSGRGGSPTLPGNGDSSAVLISRHSFPILSSVATDLLSGGVVGATSAGYLNSLVLIQLDVPGALPSGSRAGTLVGTLSAYVGITGQFFPAAYSLPAGVADNAVFALPGASTSGRLDYAGSAPVSAAGRPALGVQVTADVGLGSIRGVGVLSIPVAPPLGTATTVTNAAPNPALAGQAVALTVVVASPGGTPAGTVVVFEGGAAVGAAPLNAGVATVFVTGLGVGAHELTARFVANDVFAGSAAGPVTVVIDAPPPPVVHPTAVALVPSAPGVRVGELITFAVAVTSPDGTPDGGVTLLDGDQVLAELPLDAAGGVSFSTSTLAPGPHTITARYGGAATFAGTATSITLPVSGEAVAGATTTTLGVTPAAAGAGQPVTLTARVESISSQGGVPAGRVAFRDGGQVLAEVPLDESGQAVAGPVVLAAGTHALTAVYTPDGPAFSASASAVVAVKVAEPAPPKDSLGIWDPATATWYVLIQGAAKSFVYGLSTWTPIVGDWDGDGVTTIGTIDPVTLTWYLRNSNTAGPADAGSFQFGVRGWIPVVGDWNGDGKDDLGIFDPGTATWYLFNAGVANKVQFGVPGWTPIVGDWTKFGRDSIGVFDPATATFYEYTNLGVNSFQFGVPGCRPVAGDWDGDGLTSVGVIEPVTSTWYLRGTNTAGVPDAGAFQYGVPGWVPLRGAWEGRARAASAEALRDLAAVLADLEGRERDPLDLAFGA